MKYGVSIQDQINEANKKLQLHEGDLKAYKESTNQQMNENKQLIYELTVTNKQLHKQLASVLRGDEKVIEAALGDHKSEKQALKTKAGKDVVNVSHNSSDIETFLIRFKRFKIRFNLF